MITNGLVQTLIQKNIISNSTQVKARFKKFDYGMRSLMLEDLFTVDRIEKHNDNYAFHVTRIGTTAEKAIIMAADILKIDGMDPDQIAAAYELEVEGNKKPQGKRRGRPRKWFPYGEDA